MVTSTLVKKLSMAAAGAALSLGVMNINPAQAASFDFSYTLQNGRTLSGILDGEIQADNDTVLVSAITTASFDGVLSPSLPFVESLRELVRGPSGAPTVSFSGLVMDIIACTSPACFDGFLFDAGNALGFPRYSSGVSYGGTFEAYIPSQWQLKEKSPASVPEPASVLGLLAVGAMGAGSALKRKKQQQA